MASEVDTRGAMPTRFNENVSHQAAWSIKPSVIFGCAFHFTLSLVERGDYISRGQNGDVATVARPWVSQGKTPTLWREWLPQKCLILGRVRYNLPVADGPFLLLTWSLP